jgi:hypothetical protein
MSVDDGNVFKNGATASQAVLLQLQFLESAGSGAVSTPVTENGGAPSRRTATADAVADVMQVLIQQQHEEQIRLINQQLDRMDEASVRALQEIEDGLAAVRRERAKMREQAYHDEQGRAIFMKADASAAFYEDGTQLDDETFDATKDRLTGKPTWEALQSSLELEDALIDERNAIHTNDALREQLREDVAAGKISPADADQRLTEIEAAAPDRVRRLESDSGQPTNDKAAQTDLTLGDADIALANIRRIPAPGPG